MHALSRTTAQQLIAVADNADNVAIVSIVVDGPHANVDYIADNNSGRRLRGDACFSYDEELGWFLCRARKSGIMLYTEGRGNYEVK